MQDFIKISKYAGMRNDLAQAGGGNTSFKMDEQTMLVKSSGVQLADVSEAGGYTKVNYRLIVDYCRENIKEEGSVLTEEAGKELLTRAQITDGRASIETFLHAVTGKYTLHSHPTLVNILTARTDGMDVLGTLFPKAVFVPYRKPGAALAETYYRLYQKQQAQGADGSVIFLANHGLVVSGDSAEQVIDGTEEVLHKIVAYLEIDDSAQRAATELYRIIHQIDALKGNIVYLSENRYLSQEYAGAGLIEKGVWNHAFCPDCVVYANKKPLWLRKDDKEQVIRDFIERHGIPALIYYEGHFYILAESVKKAQEIENVMSFAAQVQMADLTHEMAYLSEGQQDALLNWDAEKYRRQKA